MQSTVYLPIITNRTTSQSIRRNATEAPSHTTNSLLKSHPHHISCIMMRITLALAPLVCLVTIAVGVPVFEATNPNLMQRSPPLEKDVGLPRSPLPVNRIMVTPEAESGEYTCFAML